VFSVSTNLILICHTILENSAAFKDLPMFTSYIHIYIYIYIYKVKVK